MSLLVFALVVAIIVGLLVWAIRTIPIPSPLNVILQVAVILVGVIVIAQRAGVF
jgi:hypothetical protein